MVTLAALINAIHPLQPVRLDEKDLAREVVSVTHDSREVVPGSVFVAIKGASVDGHEYIAEAFKRGCSVVIAEKEPEGGAFGNGLVLVADSHAAMGELAAVWYGNPTQDMVLVGLTGTNGKTTCTYLLEELLLFAGYRPGVIGTVNYRYHDQEGRHILQEASLTTPEPLVLQRILRVMVDKGVTHVLMEVSSHALMQKRLGSTKFDVAVFTNLSRDHLDYHRTMELYFAGKKLLFDKHLKEQGTAVVVRAAGQSHDWGQRLIEDLRLPRLIRCGLTEECEVAAHDQVHSIDGFDLVLHIDGEAGTFHSSLIGHFNVLNMLAVAGVGHALGLPFETICKGLAGVSTVPGRLERIALPGVQGVKGNPVVFVDYAHTPDALDNVFKALQQIVKARIVCIFGCGGDRDRGKRYQMGEIAGNNADMVIVTSDNPRSENPEKILEDIVPGVKASGKTQRSLDELFVDTEEVNGFAVIEDRREAITRCCCLAANTDCILIAGKGHEQYQLLGTQKVFFDDCLEAVNGMLQWNRSHLLAATGGVYIAGRKQVTLGEISTDTRKLTKGDVFVALRGDKFDGHNCLAQAVEAGAAALVVEEASVGDVKDALVIQVGDTLKALGDLAAYRRRLLGPRVQVAAITGSSGKTTVKEMTAGIFAQELGASGHSDTELLKTRGNFNNLVGLPLSLLPVDGGHRHAILEMGMNDFGEIQRLTAIAAPDIGCITNIQPAHLEGLGSLAGVAQAKGELFAGMKKGAIRVVNYDDPNIRALAKADQGPKIGFAVSARGRTFKPEVRATRENNLGRNGMRFTLHIGTFRCRFTLPVPGEHNVSNAVAAAAIAHAAGIDPETIVAGLQAYETVDKRFVISEVAAGVQVVNDTYNANPASMEAALRTVASLGSDCKRVAVLGDMFELGEAAVSAHGGIGELVGQLGFDLLAVTGEHSREIARCAEKSGMAAANVNIFPTPQAIASWIFQMITNGVLSSGDWVLVKGSRGMRMETMIGELESLFELQPGEAG